MNRRDFLRGAAMAAAGATFMNARDTRSRMGIATTSYMIGWRPHDTMEFLERCHSLGAAGVQCAINGDLPTIRSKAEEWQMYIEAMVPMPHGSDTTQMEQALRDAKEVGAVALRSACLGTRRYETFTTYEQWKQHVAEAHTSIRAALPVLEKYKIPLGLENHKDWTAEELAGIMKQYSGEFFGTCVDFGNNIALLDDPMGTIEALAPYAVCTHVKDMGVEDMPEGFQLSEVLLGNGFIDLPHAIALIRRSGRDVRFSLEMITRDPLKVPCLTDDYWATFPDRNGIYLARTLRFVQEHQPPSALPRVAQYSHDQLLKVENQNVIACLKYAHENLGL